MKSPKKKMKSPKKSTTKWVIYTKRGCPYCANAKKLLRKHKQPFESVAVNEKNKEEIYKKIDRRTKGYRYFPIVFKGNRFVGGFDELEKKLS